MYLKLEEGDRVTDYRNSPVVSEGVLGNLTRGADPDVNNLPEGIDDNDN